MKNSDEGSQRGMEQLVFLAGDDFHFTIDEKARRVQIHFRADARDQNPLGLCVSVTPNCLTDLYFMLGRAAGSARRRFGEPSTNPVLDAGDCEALTPDDDEAALQVDLDGMKLCIAFPHFEIAASWMIQLLICMMHAHQLDIDEPRAKR